MASEFVKFRMEQASLRAKNEKLKVVLRGKSLALDQKDKAINDLKEDHARDVKEKEEEQAKAFKTQHANFINQMMAAKNDYFLEGWEAAWFKLVSIRLLHCTRTFLGRTPMKPNHSSASKDHRFHL